MARRKTILHRKGIKAPVGYNGFFERMADAIDVDVDAAIDAEKLNLDQVNRMLRRCSSCGDTDGCMKWLSDRSAPKDEGWPDCPSRKLLLSLKKGEAAKAGKPDIPRKR